MFQMVKIVPENYLGFSIIHCRYVLINFILVKTTPLLGDATETGNM